VYPIWNFISFLDKSDGISEKGLSFVVKLLVTCLRLL
jgi:hypothetical protein